MNLRHFPFGKIPGKSLGKLSRTLRIEPFAERSSSFSLEGEYGAEAEIETAPWQIIRWLRRKDGAPVGRGVTVATGTALVVDERSRPVALFPDSWPLRFFPERNPALELSELPFDAATVDQPALASS